MIAVVIVTTIHIHIKITEWSFHSHSVFSQRWITNCEQGESNEVLEVEVRWVCGCVAMGGAILHAGRAVHDNHRSGEDLTSEKIESRTHLSLIHISEPTRPY